MRRTSANPMPLPGSAAALNYRFNPAKWSNANTPKGPGTTGDQNLNSAEKAAAPKNGESDEEDRDDC